MGERKRARPFVATISFFTAALCVMTEQRFFVSRFFLVYGLVMVIAVTVTALFMGWFTYFIGAQSDGSPLILTILGIFSAFCGVASLVLWTKILALIRRRAEPVISFKADSVTYQTNTGEMVSIPLSEIWGVEVESLSPEYGGGNILIRRSNSQIDKIYHNNLGASYKEVFLAFKERAPHLRQPYSTVWRLNRAVQQSR